MVLFHIPEKEYLKQVISRNLAAAICTVALAVSLWNAVHTEELPPAIPSAAEEQTAQEMFETLRTEREQMRQLCFAQLSALIQEEGTSGAERNSAETALVALTDAAMQEENIRAMLLARGFADALVTVEDNSVNVLVKGHVSEADAAMILELVVRETQQDPGAVKIIALN